MPGRSPFWFLAVVLAGCAQLAGIDDFSHGDASTGGGGAAGPGGGGAGAAGGGGASGGGGQGGGGPVVAAVALGSAADDDLVDLGLDAGGEVFIAGAHHGELALPEPLPVTAPKHLLLAKLDTAFSPVWGRSFPASEDSSFTGLSSLTDGRSAVVGTTDTTLDLGLGAATPAGSGVVLGRFDDGGAVTSSQLFGQVTAGARAGRAVVALGDDTIVGGFYEVDPEISGSFSAPPVTVRDAFVARVLANGTVDWVRYITGPGVVNVEAITVDASNRIVVAGISNLSVQIDGLQLVPPTADGHPDVFVVRLDLQGNVLDGRSFGGAGRDDVDGLAALDDRIFLGGHFLGALDGPTGPVSAVGEEDGYIASFDAELDLEWVASFGGPGRELIRGLASHASGLVAAVGYTEAGMVVGSQTFTAVDEDPFVVVLDADGNLAWADVWAGPQFGSAQGVVFDAADELVVGGDFTSSLTLGARTLDSHGGRDLFVARVRLPEPSR